MTWKNVCTLRKVEFKASSKKNRQSIKNNPNRGGCYNRGKNSKLLCPSFAKNNPETGIDIQEHEYNSANKVKYAQEKINPKKNK